MQFAATNVDSVIGTSLVGYARATFQRLVRCFGAPHTVDGDKTTVAWYIKFEDGTVATVYDWAQHEAQPRRRMYNWHVGGFDEGAVQRVVTALRGHHSMGRRAATPCRLSD